MSQNSINAASHWSETPIARVLQPMQAFIHNSASSGIVLMVATVLALVIANSPWAESYDHFLHTPMGVNFGSFALNYSLLHWINDGLMAIFFFLVGLEIKREVLVGELSDPRAALLPILAAVGGVMVPALIYTALNMGKAGASGWAVPMATDIAFALGLLALLGDRIPFGLKIFLTAVAIVDDLIAVLVIALFYSGGIHFPALGTGFLLLAVLLGANYLGIRNIFVYVAVGVLVWLAFLQSGVHATIAGVLVAWTVPARYRIDAGQFLQEAQRILNGFHLRGNNGDQSGADTEEANSGAELMLTDAHQQHAVTELEALCEDVQAPLQKLEHTLHFWVQFVIMPIFALANAGVAFSLGRLVGETAAIPWGIILGLVLGKPIGILGVCWLTVRSGKASLPAATTWNQMVGVGFLGGIGFTMSLFIASLGFGESARLEDAKTGILLASVTAGTIGFLLLRRASGPETGSAPGPA